jgi:hypothetical protein
MIVFSGGPLTVPYAVTLLEYCLMSGMDWWDVLLALRPSMLDAVCERFSESFLRQPAAMQQYHHAQYLCIKTSLYRYSTTLLLCFINFFCTNKCRIMLILHNDITLEQRNSLNYLVLGWL